MKVYKVRLYLKTPTARNPQIAVMVMYGDGADWGSWTRIFKRRGIYPVHSLERDMTESERKKFDAAWRLIYYKYKTWEDLIKDEYRTTRNKDWCERVSILSSKQIDLQQIYDAVDHEK